MTTTYSITNVPLFTVAGGEQRYRVPTSPAITLSASIITDGTIGALAAGSISSWSWSLSGGQTWSVSSSDTSPSVGVRGLHALNGTQLGFSGVDAGSVDLFATVGGVLYHAGFAQQIAGSGNWDYWGGPWPSPGAIHTYSAMPTPAFGALEKYVLGVFAQGYYAGLAGVGGAFG